jgi:hypothetical protein
LVPRRTEVTMTEPGQPSAEDARQDEEHGTSLPGLDTAAEGGSREPIGEGDRQADAVRSGAGDVVEEDVPRDSDAMPVGRADAEADAERSGADTDRL